jgi:hypothetical protein
MAIAIEYTEDPIIAVDLFFPVFPKRTFDDAHRVISDVVLRDHHVGAVQGQVFAERLEIVRLRLLSLADDENAFVRPPYGGATPKPARKPSGTPFLRHSTAPSG